LGWRQPGNKLKLTLETSGGISGCARKYAVNKKTARRKNGGGQNNIIQRQLGLGESSKINTAVSQGAEIQE
jgi:hypothetical protein